MPQPIARPGESSGKQQRMPATRDTIASALVPVGAGPRRAGAVAKTWAPGAEKLGGGGGAGAGAGGAARGACSCTRGASEGTSNSDAQALHLALLPARPTFWVPQL